MKELDLDKELKFIVNAVATAVLEAGRSGYRAEDVVADIKKEIVRSLKAKMPKDGTITAKEVHKILDSL